MGLAGLLVLAGGLASMTEACGSSGNTAAGGTCYLATDCAAGLICIGVTATTSGTCSNNVATVQPDASAVVDGGKLPQMDAPPGPDSPTTGDTAPPTDSGGTDTKPPADTGPVDTGPPPMDSGGA